MVKYRKNRVLLYTSSVAPSYPLLVDSSLYTPNGQLAQATVSSGFREVTKYYYLGGKRVAMRNASGVTYLRQRTYQRINGRVVPFACTANYANLG